MGETADAIRHDIEHRRREMTSDVQELEDRARSMVDWRQQFRERPMAAVGLAAAGGLLLGMLTSRSNDDEREDRGRSYAPSYTAYQPTSYPSYATRAAGEGNGRDAQQQAPGMFGWVSGQYGPSQATDAGKHRAASKVDEIRGALMALAATKAEEFLREAIPGFGQEVEKVKRDSDSGDRRSNNPDSRDNNLQHERAVASQRTAGATGNREAGALNDIRRED